LNINGRPFFFFFSGSSSFETVDSYAFVSADETAYLDAADGDAPYSYPLSSAASVNAPTHK
jgi:hypothetical protein